MPKESEETEVKKDLNWLKNYVDETETTIKSLLDGETTYSTRVSLKGSLATLKDFRGYINQLDEPEVLSQEWLDEHAKAVTYDGIPDQTEIVYVDDLQNLLVPKQEETNDDLYILKVGGGYVTDFELTGGRVSAFSRGSEYDADVVMASKPFMEFVQKQVGGELYNVTNPKEQKYYVSARVQDYGGFWFLSKNNNGDVSIGTNKDYFEADWDTLKLTEQEIKDYDERYLAFKVPVEEPEE